MVQHCLNIVSDYILIIMYIAGVFFFIEKDEGSVEKSFNGATADGHQ